MLITLFTDLDFKYLTNLLKRLRNSNVQKFAAFAKEAAISKPNAMSLNNHSLVHLLQNCSQSILIDRLQFHLQKIPYKVCF